MVVSNTIKMDLKNKSTFGAPPQIKVMQNDRYSRKIVFELFDGGNEWTVPSGVSAYVRYQRADGTGGNYDKLNDGSDACKCVGNTVTVTLAPEVLLFPGRAKVCVGIVKDDVEINTFVANIDVQENPGIVAHSGGYLKLAGTVADAGWEANKYLGTDAAGKVVAMAAPVIFGTTDLTPGVSALPTGVLYVVYE